MPLLKTCENCGIEFRVKPRDASRKYCGRPCQKEYEAAHGRNATRKEPVFFSCKTCSKQFPMMPSYLTAYRKKHGKDPLYCSMPCSDIGRRRDAEIRNSRPCEHCGTVFTAPRKPVGRLYTLKRFCSFECRMQHRINKSNARLAAGNFTRYVKRHGYVWIRIPPQKFGEKHREMLEHRYVMEQHLGRPLTKQETVHHRDGNRGFNAIDNLELFSSRHGPGQRVIDQVAFAIDTLRTYPEFAREAGVELRNVESVVHAEKISV